LTGGVTYEKRKQTKMVYINSEGHVGNAKKRRFGLGLIKDFIVGIFDFVGLFFRTLTASPATLEAERGQRRTTYAQRQGPRGGGGPNIRGVNRLGTARAGAGG
jgi:hypothetical protein